MSSISIKKAVTINFISKYVNVFAQLLINSVLARILTPDDYGVVAIINVFISFFTIVADMGIGPAIIQYKDLSKKQISDIFVFTIAVAVISSIGFIGFSYPLSIIYQNKVYVPLGMILSIGIFFNVINIVPNALLLKNKQFKSLGIRNVIINLIGGIITIILAIQGAKYYALVINSVVIGFFTFIFNYYCSKIKVFFKFSFDSIKQIQEFSTYQFGFNFINYFSRNLDNLFIGKFMGQIALGYYDKAYKLVLYPVQNLTHVITPVLHPILSDYNNKDRIYYEYLKIVKLLLILGIFFSAFCYFSADEIILIMFGNQWIDSISTFKILSITIWIQMVMSTTGSIFQSLGDTKSLFRVGIITTIINVVAITIGVLSLKIELVSLCILISFSINLCITFYYLINKSLSKSVSQFLNELKCGVGIAIIMIVSYIAIPITVNNIIFAISIKLVIAMISLIVGLLVTKEISIFKIFFKRRIKAV